jgi:hypothetical protein
MAGGYTYDNGVTIIPDLIPDTQPAGTIPTSPCGKVLLEKQVTEQITLKPTTTKGELT